MFRILMILLAGCGGATACGKPPPPKTPDGVVMTDLPPMPDWVEPYIGRAIGDAFPDVGESCLGFIDRIDARFGGAAGGVEVSGWGWSVSGAQAYTRFVATDESGAIRGGGVGGIERGDVVVAIPTVTQPMVGYVVRSNQSTGKIRVFGISNDAVCQVGPELAL